MREGSHDDRLKTADFSRSAAHACPRLKADGSLQPMGYALAQLQADHWGDNHRVDPAHGDARQTILEYRPRLHGKLASQSAARRLREFAWAGRRMGASARHGKQRARYVG